MGLGQSTHATYVTIYEGKLCLRVKDQTPTSKTRVNKQGNTVHEEFYDHLTGNIVNIDTREHDQYGKQWMITLRDSDGKNYVLQIAYSGGPSNAFLRALPNVELSKPVTLVPKMTIDGDKKRTTLFVNQNGKALKWNWTKDNPGDLPPMQKVKIKGKDQWDDSDQMEYLESYVRNEVLPQLHASGAPVPDVEVQETEVIKDEEPLPF